MIIRTKRNLILKLRYHESKNVFKSTTLYIKAKYNHIYSVVMVFEHLTNVCYDFQIFTRYYLMYSSKSSAYVIESNRIRIMKYDIF